MKRIFLGLFAALVVCQVYAQKSPVKFGDVPLEDLKMTVYANDTSAAAVVLVDYGESAVKYDQGKDEFVLTFERTTRIKILKKDGLSEANQEIYLYRDGSVDEKISGLKVITYNLENGKVVETKSKSENFFKEKYSVNLDIVKVAPVAVREGSIVDITYKVTSEFLINFQDWEFQRTIPVRCSEYRASFPEYFGYEKYMQGYLPLAISENNDAQASITITSKERSGHEVSHTEFSVDKIDYKEMRSRWVVKDAPAFREEPFITTYKDYISKINFELAYTKFPNSAVKPMLGSWEQINEKYYESADFGGEVTGNGFLKKPTEEVTAGADTPEKKIALIHAFLSKRMTWNERSQRFSNTALKKVYEDQRGNSAEINLLLASMMEKAGLEAHAVLLSTRDHGFIRKTTPQSSQFNYVICAVRVGDKYVLLDATDKFLPAGVLPERCLNGEGMVVSKLGPSWVSLVSPLKSKKVVSANLTLDTEGSMKGSLRLDQTGYYAQAGRKRYFEAGEKEYVKKFQGEHAWQIEKSTFQNSDLVGETFKEEHNLLVTESTGSTDIIYLDMFLTMRESENPFKSEKRDYPVDFGSPLEKMYIAKFVIPDGYVIDELPKPKVVLLPGNSAKYTFNVTQLGNQLNLTSQLQINKSLFTQEEYPHLREFYNQVVAKQAEQIVLKKK